MPTREVVLPSYAGRCEPEAVCRVVEHRCASSGWGAYNPQENPSEVGLANCSRTTETQ